MSTPAIGKMRYRVTLQQPARTPDGGGGASVAWTNVSDLWAALMPIGGNEGVEADGLKGRTTHEIWVRFQAGLGPHMRFILGARVFDIRSITDIEEAHRFQRCLVEERLP